MMQLKNQILRMILQHSNVFGGRFSLRRWEKHVIPTVLLFMFCWPWRQQKQRKPSFPSDSTSLCSHAARFHAIFTSPPPNFFRWSLPHPPSTRLLTLTFRCNQSDYITALQWDAAKGDAARLQRSEGYPAMLLHSFFSHTITLFFHRRSLHACMGGELAPGSRYNWRHDDQI